ncbi:hypothetical protein PINS_up001314 [Pythium insidiosum]|nr:hypothetical protein PINS_up001314 [Pythium insidiosum]
MMSPSGRRVKFSPFAKSKRKLRPTRLMESDVHARPVRPASSDCAELSGAPAGLTFSPMPERENKREARRQRELHVMQALYNAASQKRRGLLAVVEDHLTLLKSARQCAQRWLRLLQAPLLAYCQPQRNRNVLRSRLRHAPLVYFDPRDEQYAEHLSRPLIPTTSAGQVHLHRPQGVHEDLDPDTTRRARVPSGQHGLTKSSSHQGALVSLLRREGLQPDEDVTAERDAVRNDLRGITVRSAKLHVVPTPRRQKGF